MSARTVLFSKVFKSIHARIIIYWSLVLCAFFIFREDPETISFDLVSQKRDEPIVAAFTKSVPVKIVTRTSKRTITIKSKGSRRKKKTALISLNINTANQSKLQSLKGVGAVLAKRIVQYRDQHGLFTSVDDLVHVKGIGPKTVEKLKNQARVSR
jgi:comEA protein